MKPGVPSDLLPLVLRRAFLGLAVVLLALGAFASWGAATCLRDLRQVRLHGRPEPRTAQEDPAMNPYWLDVFARLNGAFAGGLLLSGTAALWFRSRLGR